MTIKHLLISAGLVVSGLSISTSAAGTDRVLGEVILVGYNFCPRGTINADGQLIQISSKMALFSLYGTTYGGDGRTTFGMPDLRGRTVISAGMGPGLSNRRSGQRSGSETNTITANQIPAGEHRGDVSGAGDTASLPNPMVLGGGQGKAQNNMQPYLTMKYCIVTNGTFPSRS